MQPKSIRLIKDEHKGQEILKLAFEYDSDLITKSKSLGCKWSQSKKCWYLENTPTTYKKVIGVFKGTAWVDASALFNDNKPILLSTNHIETQKEHKRKPIPIIRVELPKEIELKLEARRYSENTRRTYVSMLQIFFNYFSKENKETLSKEKIQEFILHLKNKRNYSPSSQNQAVNAIKFYYEQVLGQERKFYWIERPRKEQKLPKVISEEEIIRMLNSINNLKHLCIVSLLYSSGLRRSELLNLKRGAINIDRNQVKVEGGKGNKDRITMLSEVTKELLKQYVLEYKPTNYLFEGKPGYQYSATSVANIVKKAAKKAGIPMVVTPHILRHSFATHLMDQGIETRYIQTLLGHQSLETTAIYAHVSTKNLNLITSPLDKINKNKQLNFNNLNSGDKNG